MCPALISLMFQEYIPDLYNHFLDISLEAHMYASQWFLTLFTAKFPLYMVFHIIDLLLCEVRIRGKDLDVGIEYFKPYQVSCPLFCFGISKSGLRRFFLRPVFCSPLSQRLSAKKTHVPHGDERVFGLALRHWVSETRGFFVVYRKTDQQYPALLQS